MTVTSKSFPIFELMILSVLAEKSLGATDLRSEISKIRSKEPAQAQLALALHKMLKKSIITRDSTPPRPVRGGRRYFKYHITNSGRDIISLHKKLLDTQAGS